MQDTRKTKSVSAPCKRLISRDLHVGSGWGPGIQIARLFKQNQSLMRRVDSYAPQSGRCNNSDTECRLRLSQASPRRVLTRLWGSRRSRMAVATTGSPNTLPHPPTERLLVPPLEPAAVSTALARRPADQRLAETYSTQ